MTTDELRQAARGLSHLHQRFCPLFGRPEAQRHSQVYVKGLLLSEEGRSVEPIALNFSPDGGGRREVLAMQRFWSVSPWDHHEVQREIQAVFAEQLVSSVCQCSIGTVGVIDESAFVKRGTESVGSQAVPAAAPKIALRSPDDSRSHRVQVNVATETPAVRFAFHQNGLESSLEQHSGASVAAIEPRGVT